MVDLTHFSFGYNNDQEIYPFAAGLPGENFITGCWRQLLRKKSVYHDKVSQ